MISLTIAQAGAWRVGLAPHLAAEEALKKPRLLFGRDPWPGVADAEPGPQLLFQLLRLGAHHHLAVGGSVVEVIETFRA
jgi:hypothetical protein